jgi:RNA polymerase sigma-70 factor (ECF subfamily)
VSVPGGCTLEIEEIYRLYSRSVARWVARLGGSTVDLEDLVQEVFVIAHRRLPTFRQEAQLGTWLYGISSYVVQHERSRQRWRSRLGFEGERKLAELPGLAPLPSEQIETREAERQVYRILDGLHQRYREVLILFELEGLSGEEVAKLLGITQATLWVLLHRARAGFIRRAHKLGLTEIARRG